MFIFSGLSIISEAGRIGSIGNLLGSGLGRGGWPRGGVGKGYGQTRGRPTGQHRRPVPRPIAKMSRMQKA